MVTRIDINNMLAGALSYLGFPSDMKVNIDKSVCNGSVEYFCSLGFSFSVPHHDRNSVYRCSDSLRIKVDSIFNKLIESKPVQDIIEKKNIEINDQEKTLKNLQDEVKRLSKYEDHFLLAKELKQ